MTILKPFLEKIQSGVLLTQADMSAAVGQVMDGQCSEAEIAAFLMGLSVRGETPDEIAGAALALRERAVAIKAPAGTIDCCGTGGDHSGSYNISTAVALVAAACGVPVAKHGNRAATSKSGAADVLEALGVSLDVPTAKLEDALRTLGFAFLMAPRHHQAMKHVLPVRRALGVRTLFNLLGPLANPAGTKRQLMGVYDRRWVLPLAQTLQQLGSEAAWVVNGSDGLDEITVTGETYFARLENGRITEGVLTPEDFGLPRSAPESLRGGDAQTNADAMLAMLEGQKGAYRDIVIANTAAVLVIAGKFPHDGLKDAAQFAALMIDEGKALALLNAYKDFTLEQREPASA
ncbi:MAG: anthranilate phosphoribosyltransferase [Alphaproteobacteria bacterium]|nr:anthranilate phosphoribosyltransferase [Alphaproteobacteria bacterium]